MSPSTIETKERIAKTQTGRFLFGSSSKKLSDTHWFMLKPTQACCILNWVAAGGACWANARATRATRICLASARRDKANDTYGGAPQLCFLVYNPMKDQFDIFIINPSELLEFCSPTVREPWVCCRQCELFILLGLKQIWGGFKHVLFSIIYGNNHPNWQIHIFQRGRSTTNQLSSYPKKASFDIPKANFASNPYEEDRKRACHEAVSDHFMNDWRHEKMLFNCP